MIRTAILLFCALSLPLCGALTEEQRVQDFQTLTSIYAKRYAPANWKIQALGVNPFEVGAWMKQVKEAKSDLEFIEVMMRYVASFQDTHVSLAMTSTFVAQTGIVVDLYDGKVVIELVQRALLPLAQYPFVNGDEVVSVDGRPALDLAREFAGLRGAGNPRAALRAGVGRVTSRTQSAVPQAVNVPEKSTIVIRRQNGDLETYEIPWVKSGYPVREIGGVPSPYGFHSGVRLHEPYIPSDSTDESQLPSWKKEFYERHTSAASKEDTKLIGEPVETEDGVRLEPKALLNYGSRFPWFVMPPGFQQRLGNGANDIFYSGIFPSEGFRMGYFRVPNFPTYTAAQLTQLYSEIAFLNANTDGLIVDVARNTGGTICSGVDLASTLIPGGLRYAGLAYRPYLSLIVSYDQQISSLQTQGAPSWATDLLSFEKKMLEDAYYNGRGLTGPIAFCNWDLTYPSAPAVYTKPMIVLVDDFSTSTGDYFPALIQDNKRAKLVGTRTNGAGGSVIDLPAGWYSETNTRVTVSLMVRPEEREFEGFPKSPYIENTGVRPDIELDYMTVENAATSGRPYSNAFARILAEEIRGARLTSAIANKTLEDK
jgi:hypothetical protein